MTNSTYETATFAAGCFWGVQELFDQVEGVKESVVGYTGGHVAHPTYEAVCTNRTGHAEAVQLQYDPSIVSYEDLLDMFWQMHDPTTPNRQGPNIGMHYRSAIFYHSDEQKVAAEVSKATQQKQYMRPIVTQILPAEPFWKAENYHQKFNKKHSLSGCHFL